ncbi:MAG: NAD(P)/FAD-dependent oxidoreductase [Chitinophagaceae bacterium]|nr:MAG: NAD(P)/FAD-dependent oxidoreductase [Chitinophagaceae bacterium]
MKDKIKTRKQLVVIGGGAAGFFCAVNAARINPALQVLILEKSNKLLSKVKISGGGRCNVTHACFDITEMSKRYPRGQHFVKKTFHQFFTSDTIKWFEERQVPLKTEKDGRMFPVSNSSQSIINCLLHEAEKFDVSIKLNTAVQSVKVFENSESFDILCENGESIQSDYLVIACGGFPKSTMFNWIRELGHSIEEPVPSLFTFNLPRHPLNNLMGVSVEKVSVKIASTKLEEKGPLMITHWGLSGPAILRLSAWGAKELSIRNWKFTISINWISEFNEQSIIEKFKQLRNEFASQKIVGKNPFNLPQRLWEFLATDSGVKSEWRWADFSILVQHKLIKNLCLYTVEVSGKTTFKEEFVTAGGVQLKEVEASTMESKIVPNLFFAGEVLDIDGITGGYNFQQAWTSGWIAAHAIQKKATVAQ